jgi:small subunit ribosomal protein S6
MHVKNYETVFILNPVLSDAQVKETVERFKQILVNLGAEVYHEENWGLKKLAYPIEKKTTGFYCLLQFKGTATNLVNVLEVEYKRDEKVMRYLTVAMDKFAMKFAEKRRNRKSESTNA